MTTHDYNPRKLFVWAVILLLAGVFFFVDAVQAQVVVTASHNKTIANSYSDAAPTGMIFNFTNNPVKVLSILRLNSSNCGYCGIFPYGTSYSGSSSRLAECTVSGGKCTFSTPFSPTNNTAYHFVCYGSSNLASACTQYQSYSTSYVFPVTDIGGYWVGGVGSNGALNTWTIYTGATTYIYNIYGLELNYTPNTAPAIVAPSVTNISLTSATPYYTFTWNATGSITNLSVYVDGSETLLFTNSTYFNGYFTAEEPSCGTHTYNVTARYNTTLQDSEYLAYYFPCPVRELVDAVDEMVVYIPIFILSLVMIILLYIGIRYTTFAALWLILAGLVSGTLAYLWSGTGVPLVSQMHLALVFAFIGLGVLSIYKRNA